jgi:ABC-type thiamin/hydroxymethylpyrimidine transport system permease subunit
MDFEFDEEMLIAMGMGIVCAIVMLAMFKFGHVEIGKGFKLVGMLFGFIAGTFVSKWVFSGE